MIYQDINFKICLSLFGWKENILPKQHIVEKIFLQVNPAIGSALERQMGLHVKRVAEHQTVDRFFDRNNFQFP